jgi:hypothetical protein
VLEKLAATVKNDCATIILTSAFFLLGGIMFFLVGTVQWLLPIFFLLYTFLEETSRFPDNYKKGIGMPLTKC